MLRAVRFSAAFDFPLDAATHAAIRAMAAQIDRGQPRTHRHGNAVACLPGPASLRGPRPPLETGLAAVLLPEIVPADDAGQHLAWPTRWKCSGGSISPASRWPWPRCCTAGSRRRPSAKLCCWRLANQEMQRAAWLVEHRALLAGRAAAPVGPAAGVDSPGNRRPAGAARGHCGGRPGRGNLLPHALGPAAAVARSAAAADG